jgi:hypothetical protein
VSRTVDGAVVLEPDVHIGDEPGRVVARAVGEQTVRVGGAAITVHFFVMGALTYSGVWVLDHIWLNLNRFYMATVMVAPMAVVMVLAMWHMFPKPRVNVALLIEGYDHLDNREADWTTVPLPPAA